MTNSKSSAKELTDKELRDLGRNLQHIYETGYTDKKQAVVFSFYKGVAAGFGAFLGGTIVIALLVWILNLFSNPWAERLIQVLSNSPAN